MSTLGENALRIAVFKQQCNDFFKDVIQSVPKSLRNEEEKGIKANRAEGQKAERFIVNASCYFWIDTKYASISVANRSKSSIPALIFSMSFSSSMIQ